MLMTRLFRSEQSTIVQPRMTYGKSNVSGAAPKIEIHSPMLAFLSYSAPDAFSPRRYSGADGFVLASPQTSQKMQL